MVKIQCNSVFTATAVLLATSNTSQAWSAGPRVPQTKNCHSTALYYRTEDNFKGVVKPIPALYASSYGAEMVGNEELSFEQQLEAAMNYARDMDRIYGLCTPASTRAWQIVDELYMVSSAGQKVEDNVKKVFGEEKSIWSMYERA